MSVRIVISVDLPTDDPSEAYRQLCRMMAYLGRPMIEGWESSDEWFNTHGALMSTDEIQKIRMEKPHE